MKFGTRAADAPPPSGGSGSFIKYFQQGETMVRFLEEMDDWTEYYEHFNKAKSRSFPCTRDRDTCPGCTAENERDRSASRRYLVNLLDSKTGYVDLWKVPTSIIEDLRRYEAKDDTITVRFYTVIRYKTIENGQERVKYSVDREEKDNSPLDQHTENFRDHEQALVEAYTEAWGDLDEAESPIQEAKMPKVAAKPKAEPKEDDKPPFEEPVAEEDDSDDDDEITEDELNQMSADQLKSLFKQAGLPVPRTTDEEALRTRLIQELGE